MDNPFDAIAPDQPSPDQTTAPPPPQPSRRSAGSFNPFDDIASGEAHPAAFAPHPPSLTPTTEAKKPPAEPEDAWLGLGRKMVSALPGELESSAGAMARTLGETTPRGALQSTLETIGMAPIGGTVLAPTGIGAMEKPVAPQLAAWGAATHARAEEDLKQYAPSPNDPWTKQAAFTIADGLVKTAPWLIAAGVTKNPAIGMAGVGVFGADAFASKYAEAREAGRNTTQANMDASVTAMAQTIPMMLPLGAIMRPGQRFLSKTLSTATAWAAQSALTDLIQEGYNKGVLDENTPWSEVLKRVGWDAVTGFVTGAIAGGAEHATEAGRDSYRNWQAQRVQDRALLAWRNQFSTLGAHNAASVPATDALSRYSDAHNVIADAEQAAHQAISGPSATRNVDWAGWHAQPNQWAAEFKPPPEAPQAPPHEPVRPEPPTPPIRPEAPGAEAQAPEAPEAPPVRPEPKPTDHWREIGANSEGKPLYEDPRGVRSYLDENGVRITEPVQMRPGHEGMGIATDRTANPEFEVKHPFSDIAPDEPTTLPGEKHGEPERPEEPVLEPPPPKAPDVFVRPEEGEPADRRKPLERQEDVGERMEGKRSQVDRTIAKLPEEKKLDRLVDLTRDATDFRSVLDPEATSGAHNYVHTLRQQLYSFVQHFGDEHGGWSGRNFSDILSDRWAENPSMVQEEAAEYITAMQNLRDQLAGARTVADVHKTLKGALLSDQPKLDRWGDVEGDWPMTDLGDSVHEYARQKYYWKRNLQLHRRPDGLTFRDTDKVPDKATPIRRPSLPIEDLKREGLPDWRGGADTNSQTFMETFGFRGVEFGEWVTGREGLLHVNAAFDALKDFSGLLGVPDTALSLGGKLGLAFGSRGKGQASAHFEPSNNVINLTKTRGDGSLSHEWMHALDHAVSKTPAGKRYIDSMKRALERDWSTTGALSTLDGILKGTIYISNAKRIGEIGTGKQYVDSLWKVGGWGARVRTQFKADADALGKDYWGTDVEMFARAGEAYVYDRLLEQTQASPYLVNEFVSDGFVSKESGYRGRPFPADAERKRINQIYADFFSNLVWDEKGNPTISDTAALPEKAPMQAVEDALKAVDLQRRWSELHESGTRRPTDLPPPGPERPPGESAGYGAGEGHGDETSRTGGGAGERGAGTGAGEAPPGRPPEGEVGGGEHGAGNGGERGAEGPSALGPGGQEQDRAERGIRGLNFRIEPGEGFRPTTALGRMYRNIDAINALKRAETAGEISLADQKILSGYVGWGGLPQVFDEKNAKFAQPRTALKHVLTGPEYASARASTINAHYTSEDVVRGMWQAMENLGFKGGTVLEPGMGVGNFLGMSPAHLDNHFTGVELDSITGRIARALYPEARVFVKGFEETPLPRNAFDMVIGNVPFADVKPNDKEYNPGRSLSLHNYFIHKAAHMLKPGGVMGVITTHYTLDAGATKARDMLRKAGLDLVGAVRMPDTAFKANAGTEVTTDVLFFRKRKEGEAPGDDRWLKTGKVTLPDGREAEVNQYFLDHPENVLGEHALTGSMYGPDTYTVEGEPEGLGQKIANAAQHIGAKFDAEQNGQADPITDSIALPPEGVKDNAYYLKDGVVKQRIGPAETQPVLPDSKKNLITAFIGLRDTAREVLEAQRQEWDGKGKAPWADAQKRLNGLYDAFVKQFGPINKVQITRRKDAAGVEQEYRRYPNLIAFRDDPDVFLVSALERADEETGEFHKAAMMSQRVLEPVKEIRHADTPEDALIASMNMRGGVDLPYMSKLLGQKPADIVKALPGRIFKDPANGSYLLSEKYLAGNVRAKLALAEQAARVDPAFKDNVEALRSVQPPLLTPGDISVRLGASWVPVEDIRDFAQKILKSPVRIDYIPSEASWKVDPADPWSVANRNEWGVDKATFTRLLEDALNQRQTVVKTYDDEGKPHTDVQRTVVAQEKQRAIQDEFERWLWVDDDRAKRLTDKYNNEINNLATPKYDGSHLTLPGASLTVKLRPHQKDAAWRYLVSGNTLLDHDVGTGKTFTAIAAGMEAKRLGLVKKPAYVVPNHMLEQFSRELLQLYPGAHIIVADKDNFAGDARRRFVARTAAENWDAVIMTHSGFELIPMSNEYQRAFLQNEVTHYEELIRQAKRDSGRDDPTVKELEKAKARREAKIKALMDAKAKDTGVNFEQTGIDSIMLDEAHLFKNLEFATKNRNLPATSSQRAHDMYMKTRYIDQLSPGRGVMFMTGTPVSNSMAELYTMKRYLDPRGLAARGLSHFDAWAAAFGDMVTQAEISPDGKTARLKSRFARFRNIPELIAPYRQFADRVSAEDFKKTGLVKLPDVAGGGPQTVKIEGSDALKAYVQNLAERAEAVRNREVTPEEDNMLKISTDGRKAAIDMRLVEPGSRPEPGRKSEIVAKKVADIYHRSTARKSAQIVFLDMSTPRPESEGYSAYNDMRRELIANGVKPNEIAFIHDADNDQKKARLFEDVREGRVRVLMGSTEKMGVGTNVQKKLLALHDVDAAWRPSDLEQRHGRIVRQGNENPEVQLYRYVTEGSFDAYMWQTLERKARFINQIKHGDPAIRHAEDIDEQALSYAEVKALASGNPLILDKARADADADRLSRLRRAHQQNQQQMRWQAKEIPTRIEAAQRAMGDLQKDLATITAPKEDKYGAQIGGKTYDKRADAAKAVSDAVMKTHLQAQAEQKEVENKLGTIAGVKTSVFSDGKEAAIILHLTTDHEIEVNPDAITGALARVENHLKDIPNKIKGREEYIENLRRDLADLSGQIGRPFEREGDYNKAMARQAEIDEKLGLTKAAETSEVMPEEGEKPQAALRPFGTREPTTSRPLTTLGDGVMGELLGKTVTPKEAELLNTLEREANRMAPGAPVRYVRSLKVTYGNRWAEAYGARYYDGARSAMAVALSGDPLGHLRHETVHYLRHRGLITDQEWNALRHQAINENWIGRYGIEKRYGHDSLEEQLEEAIANHFGGWNRGGDAPGVVRPMLARLKTFFGRVGDSLRRLIGADPTYADVFRRIESGEIGRRRPGVEDTSLHPALVHQIDHILGTGGQAVGAKIGTAIDKVMTPEADELLEEARLFLTPMAGGSARARAQAKDFANADRAIDDQYDRLDDWAKKTFDKNARKDMYMAMEHEGVAAQQRQPAPADGLASLGSRERTAVLELNRRANDLIQKAISLNMTNAEPLPFWVPRMFVRMTSGMAENIGERSGMAKGEGRNLSTTTGSLKHRKYLTVGESEKAAQKKFGTDVEVVQDIRTMILGMRRLEHAIAGRLMVDKIKEVGKINGQILAATGQRPNTFTIEHPALKVFKPDFVKNPADPTKVIPARDQEGNIKGTFEPIYIDREFEGPLKAVLSKESSKLYGAAVALKSKGMSVTMFSPMMHNAVIYGKAFPAAPLRMLTPVAYRDPQSGDYHYGIQLYVDGHVYRGDDANRQFMLESGSVFINRNFATGRDLKAIAVEPTLKPGRSWTSWVASRVPYLWDRSGQHSENVKEFVDKMGDFWHNDLLWERVADLQAGLFKQIAESEMARGMDRQSAGRLAAYFSNLYAGSLPIEAMSKGARMTANLLLFSRSFTLSNLASWKALVFGLPEDVQAQILRDKGIDVLNRVQGAARRKAISLVAMDIALAHAGLALGAAAISALRYWASGIWKYNAPSSNEPGRENRVLVGFDEQGTGIYARLPTGKVGEDLLDWAVEPRETFLKKLSPYARVLYAVLANDKGFGRKLFDETDDTPEGWYNAISGVMGQVVNSFVPINQFNAGAQLLSEGDTLAGAAATVSPWAGITLNRGYPGGPARGYYQQLRDRHEQEVRSELPDIFAMIRAGETSDAQKKMAALGIARGLQRYYWRMALNPGGGLTRGQIRDLARYATPEQMAQFQALENENAQGAP